MREIGDVLYINFDNHHYGKKCKIKDINRVNGETRYDVELLDKQYNWRTGDNDLIFTFSDIHYCQIKESL